MTRNLETLRAVEVAAADRLKMLLDVRHNAQSAMEAANSAVLCGVLENAELDRLDRAAYVNGLTAVLDNQFSDLIDAAESAVWAAQLAIEEFEDETEGVRKPAVSMREAA